MSYLRKNAFWAGILDNFILSVKLSLIALFLSLKFLEFCFYGIKGFSFLYAQSFYSCQLISVC